ncbi:hypothetical protein [Georgenia faecalis]|uniref:hypothetical protein n=1 Tax=Georgenia faecalis TaxID=2483799 RepID=UPI000FDAC060|nr:hypothetical protein [Georgenia faecalis]
MEKAKPTLREIADEAVNRNGGVGGRALGRIAESRGLTLSYTTVDKIRAGTYTSRPKPQTLEALAELSGRPLSVVYEAAGVPMPLRPFAADLPPEADLLEPDQRKAIYGIVRAFVRQNRELYAARRQDKEVVGNAQHPAPMNAQHDPTPGGGEVLKLHRRGMNDGQATTETDPDAWLETADDGAPPPPPIEQAAARRTGGPSKGAQLRAQQDAAGEAPDEPPATD